MNRYEQLFADFAHPVLITSEENIFYLTGFATAARRPNQIGQTALLLTEEKASFFCPVRWKEVVQKSLGENGRIEVIPYSGEISSLARQILAFLGPDCRRIGFEKDGMNLSLYLYINQKYDELEWIDLSLFLSERRLIKTPEEIEALRVSANLACSAMERAADLIQPGITEMQLVSELEYYMRKNGSQGTPFSMKVLSGENATQIINLPDKKVISEGEIVLIDLGATVQNYSSDWTRSFAVKTSTSTQKALYELVWSVERACIEIIKPGVTFRQLMEKAFDQLRGTSFGGYFNPYLGHSIGIKSQEWPPITMETGDFVLKENMVLTIEPGIYIPGIGGVRIEDEILVKPNGYEYLTGLKKERFII